MLCFFGNSSGDERFVCAPFQDCVSRKWLSYTPLALESFVSLSGRRAGGAIAAGADGVRCLAGDSRHVLAGLYGGSVEVWPAARSTSSGSGGRGWSRIMTLRKGHQVCTLST